MRWPVVSLPFLCLLALSAFAEDSAQVRVADGFECPVGRDSSKPYYKARGFRPNGHLGEDWNGAGGGDTDFGDPVFSTAHGIVVFARDYRLGWGNVIIVRHAFMEKGQTQFVDSLYGHLNEILVREGQAVSRGQKIGTIGNNQGMYPAHLHFELRKNIHVGMFRNSFPRDFTTYWDPTQFIAAHLSMPAGAGLLATVPTNTFPATPPPLVGTAMADSPFSHGPATVPTPLHRQTPFKVDRFSDLRSEK